VSAERLRIGRLSGHQAPSEAADRPRPHPSQGARDQVRDQRDHAAVHQGPHAAGPPRQEPHPQRLARDRRLQAARVEAGDRLRARLVQQGAQESGAAGRRRVQVGAVGEEQARGLPVHRSHPELFESRRTTEGMHCWAT